MFLAIDDRKVESKGSASRAVEDGFTQHLRQAGASIALLNAPTISGQITEWVASLEPSFPASEARANARLKVIVHDSRAHPIYQATFTGEASASHPMLGEAAIQELLGRAMVSAIEAAVRDEDFLSQLARGRID